MRIAPLQFTVILGPAACTPEEPATGNTGGSPTLGGTGPTGGAPGTGGRASGGTATGGAASGGRASGGVSAGGTASGGKATGGAATGATGGVITGCSTGTAQSGDVTVTLSSLQQKISGFGVSSAWAGDFRDPAKDPDMLWSTTTGAGRVGDVTCNGVAARASTLAESSQTDPTSNIATMAT